MSHMRRTYKIVRQSRESVIALRDADFGLNINHKQRRDLCSHCFSETEVISILTIEKHCQTTTKRISNRLAFAPS